MKMMKGNDCCEKKRSHVILTGHVPKRHIKLRAPKRVGDYVSESSCPNENEVDDTAAPVSIATPDELKSPSHIIN